MFLNLSSAYLSRCVALACVAAQCGVIWLGLWHHILTAYIKWLRESG